ncbi:MAG: AzlD domain-containing protein [Legionella sp.]|nr:AzlD domain-containing protein [Legionella sp.]
MNYYTFTIVVSLFFLSIATRILPFLFTAQLSDNARMKSLGRKLTAYIMLLLVIYEVNPVSFEAYPFGLPAILSLCLVIFTHLFFKNPLLSMVLGTASFVLLNLHYT